MRTAMAAAMGLLALPGPVSAQVEDDTATTVIVMSHPPGARVWRGEALLGTTTPEGLRVTGLPPGRVTLTLTAEGYAPTARIVEVGAGGAPVVVVVRLLSVAGAASARSAGEPARAIERPASGGGGSKMPLLLVGGGLLAAGGAALALAGSPDPLTTDDDGDGVSENGGDCDDANASVRPGGGFTFTVTFAFTGAVNCAQRNPQQQAYRVRNNSCAAVTVQRLLQEQGIVGNCTGPPTRELTLTATTVAPGAETVIRSGAAAGTAVTFCCSAPPCGRGSCTKNERYTVFTDQGQQSASNTWTMTDNTGFDCSSCGGPVYWMRPADAEGASCHIDTGPS